MKFDGSAQKKNRSLPFGCLDVRVIRYCSLSSERVIGQKRGWISDFFIEDIIVFQ